MGIIRDTEFGGLMMIPLLCDWNIKRCNIKDCKEKPTTIATGFLKDGEAFGLCECHYKDWEKTGLLKTTLEFD